MSKQQMDLGHQASMRKLNWLSRKRRKDRRCKLRIQL
ncbi:hypothetical protein AALP_AAs62710U000100 [Arabis alpina]|uniref:Uncharacterized protein n=1 Tax=Arabis alpina TaxID=50452 RepID=A0A087G2E8_ARAAL|nr:hypothetical protein AALP_AAs62710U000100 [Arabis alpina]